MNILEIYEKYQKNEYFDYMSTVNSKYEISNDFCNNFTYFDIVGGTCLFLKKSLEEKDGSENFLIDVLFDPELYSKKDLITLFRKFEKHIIKITSTKTKRFIRINIHSKLNNFLSDIKSLGFKEIIRLSELELNINKKYSDLENFDYEIRLPKKDELWDVYAMVFKTQIKGTIGKENPSEEDYLGFLNDELTDLNLCTFVWNKKEIIAQITATRKGTYAEINELAVLPAYWRKGIATYITKTSLNKIYDSGIRTVRLHTDSYNRYGALDLYKKLGFKILYENIRLRYEFTA